MVSFWSQVGRGSDAYFAWRSSDRRNNIFNAHKFETVQSRCVTSSVLRPCHRRRRSPDIGDFLVDVGVVIIIIITSIFITRTFVSKHKYNKYIIESDARTVRRLTKSDIEKVCFESLPENVI